MIVAEHVTLSGNLTFERVRLYNARDIKKKGLPLHFEDATMLLENKDGHILFPSYNLILARLNKTRTKLSNSRKVRLISISGNLLFSDCYLVNPVEHDKAGVPLIFKDYEQFSFACKDGLHITTDFNIQAIQF